MHTSLHKVDISWVCSLACFIAVEELEPVSAVLLVASLEVSKFALLSFRSSFEIRLAVLVMPLRAFGFREILAPAADWFS